MTNATFNKTGVLLLKNKLDAIEYHLYDSKIPLSVDVNEVFNQYLYDNINQLIYISIENENGFKFEDVGILCKTKLYGVEKFYLHEVNEGGNITDLEEMLFNIAEFVTTIKIKVIKNNVEDDIEDYGGCGKDETTYMDK